MEQARPQTAGEEELQLQLAIAMSKEEAAKSEKEQKHDDLRLQMALSESADDPEVSQLVNIGESRILKRDGNMAHRGIPL